MTAYSQLSDAELERKVLELMGYGLREHPTYKNRYQVFLNGERVHDWWWKNPEDAWCFAPKPLSDIGTQLDLLEELKQHGINIVDEDNARAICEVYCQVKEGMG